VSDDSDGSGDGSDDGEKEMMTEHEMRETPCRGPRRVDCSFMD
jgi:hypothetical protein